MQRRHRCPTNSNRQQGNQRLSGSHVKLLAVGKKQAMLSTSQQDTPRPSLTRRRTLRYAKRMWQAQISIGTSLSRAIRANKLRDSWQEQIRAQGISPGHLRGTREDGGYQEEPQPRPKAKISFEINDRVPLSVPCKAIGKMTCDKHVRDRSCNTLLTI